MCCYRELFCSDKIVKAERDHKQLQELVRKRGLKEREVLTWQLDSANEKIADHEKRLQVYIYK